MFHTEAWTKPEGSTQFYLHQFDKGQPDLNYENPKVKEEMKKMIEFWFSKGVDGFRIDAINHAYEDERFLDEPLIDENRELFYENMDHKYTMNQVKESSYSEIPRFHEFICRTNRTR